MDGISGFFSVIETYANTNTWAVVVTVPAFVIAYVLRLFSSLGVEAYLRRRLRPILTPELFALATSSGNDALIQKYADAERHARLLHGCLVAFVLLGLGCLAEVRMLRAFGFVGYVGMTLAIIAAICCPFLARYLERQVVPLVHAVLETRTSTNRSSGKAKAE